MESPLLPILREEITSKGPILFERFMELALFHPEHGYYSRPDRLRVGRHGDFYTSVSVGPLFGHFLALHFIDLWDLLGRPSSLHLIEQGAETGQLAADILLGLKKENPELFKITQYHILEPNPLNQQRQKATLSAIDPPHPLISHSRMEEIPSEGIFFSNELPDSFPVHRITYQNHCWNQTHLTLNDGELQMIEVPFDSKTPAELIEATRNIPCIEGYTTEVNLRARQWIREMGTRLKKGFALTIDYGFPSALYYSPERTEGTLCTYHSHRKGSNLLHRPGEQDLTAHVDFGALETAGKAAGLEPVGFTSQHHFITSIGFPYFSKLENGTLPKPSDYPKILRSFKTLMHPSLMGTQFHYLLQAKALTPARAPIGFASIG